MTASLLPPPPSFRHGLANLMASLAGARGHAGLPCPPLPELPPADLAPARHLVLLVADGVGEAQLRAHLPGGLLDRARIATLESVFPSTTASAVGTFLTGLPPGQHGLTGWHVWFSAIASQLAVLPLARRGIRGPAPEAEDWAQRLLDAPPLADRLPCPMEIVSPAWIVDSPFNRRLSGRAKRTGYRALPEMFAAIETALRAPEPSYIYAYWPDFDSKAHDAGPDGPAAVAALHELERELAAFLGRVQGTDATLLVTADHGFIAAPAERLIDLGGAPELAALLACPLSGERRAAYAHLKPGCREAFRAGIEARYGHALWCVDSDNLLADGWFGPPPYHPDLRNRIGDLTLLLREDWTLRDRLPGEDDYRLAGMHGGVSTAEREVPLCRFDLSRFDLGAGASPRSAPGR